MISVASSTEEETNKTKKGGRDLRQGRERPHIACTRPQGGAMKSMMISQAVD